MKEETKKECWCDNPDTCPRNMPHKRCSEKDDLFARENDKQGYMQCQLHLRNSNFCKRFTS